MLNVSAGKWEAAVAEGRVLLKARRHVEAGNVFLGVLKEQPEHLGALRGFAEAASAVGNFELSLELSRAAAKQDPEHVGTLMVWGHAALMAAHAEEAIEVHRRVVAAAPGHARGRVSLGLSYHFAGMGAEAMEAFREAEALAPEDVEVASSALYGMHFVPGMGAAEIAEAHRAWGVKQAGREGAPAGGWRVRGRGERVRVGYVSPDFRHHSVARFMEPVLRHHDRGRVEVFCYSNSSRKDVVTERLRGLAEHWREIVWVSDEEAAGLIRKDGVDVLVDLAGHTADERLGVFAMRAAPVQVTWLGYPNTTGLGAMDYRVVDGVTDPAGSEGLCVEKLLRVGPPFLCFQMPDPMPEVNGLPALGAGGVVTFGSFNALAKVNEVCVGMWAEVLRRMARSRMLLKAAALGDPMVRERVWKMFEKEGIERGRVGMLAFEKTVGGHLGVYGRVDVALDTYPYSGTTTTCEAMVMGVPVVTRMGEWHMSRVSGSLVKAVGHGEWASESAEGFVETAMRVAGDLEGLARVRAGLRGEMAGSRLTDGAGFTREWEGVMEGIVMGDG